MRDVRPEVRAMRDGDGGPAFPYSALQPDAGARQLAGTMYADNKGISKREYFAAYALQGLLAQQSNLTLAESSMEVARSKGIQITELMCINAYQFADQMLRTGKSE